MIGLTAEPSLIGSGEWDGAMSLESGLKDLFEQLAHRKLLRPIQALLRSRKVNPGRRWTDLPERVAQAIREAQSIREELNGLIWEHLVSSDKRVLVFDVEEKFDVTALGADLPKKFLAGDYLDATLPSRPRGKVSYNFDVTVREDGSTIYSFLALRVIRQTEEVDPDLLTKEGQKKFEGFEVVAQVARPVRCYDHVVLRPNGKLLLSVDCPQGVDPARVRDDMAFYRFRIQKTLRGEADDIGPSDDETDEAERDAAKPINLFPAIKAIYAAKREGAVNFLAFESSNQAHHVGKYSVMRDDDLRDQAYHKAGCQASNIKAYTMAVRWPGEANRPYVRLPGKRWMLNNSGPLEYMEFPQAGSIDGLYFAVDRVLAHLS